MSIFEGEESRAQGAGNRPTTQPHLASIRFVKRAFYNIFIIFEAKG